MHERLCFVSRLVYLLDRLPESLATSACSKPHVRSQTQTPLNVSRIDVDYVNCKPAHALYPIQTTKPMLLHNSHFTHLHHQPKKYRESFSFETYILTALSILPFFVFFFCYQGADTCFLFHKPKIKTSLKYRYYLSPLCTVDFLETDGHMKRQAHPNIPPDSTHLCFHPSWHQVGICWFFNICTFLQTAALARFSQHGQVELMRMTAQLLNQIWGFNISWKLDRMWASINAGWEFNIYCNRTVSWK